MKSKTKQCIVIPEERAHHGCTKFRSRIKLAGTLLKAGSDVQIQYIIKKHDMIQFLVAKACFLTRFFAGRGDVFNLLPLISIGSMEWTRPNASKRAYWTNDRDHQKTLTCQCWKLQRGEGKHLGNSDSLYSKHPNTYLPHFNLDESSLVIHPTGSPWNLKHQKCNK